MNANIRCSNGKRHSFNVRFIALAFIILLGTISSAQAVRIATYNVENYNLTNRLVDGVYRKEYPKPEIAKAALREEIKAVNANVLALQEMGGEAYVRELQLDLRREGLDYPYTVVLNGPDKSRKLAILSKKPWVRALKEEQLLFDYLGEQTPVKRGLLGVVFEDEIGEWAVFNVHLKGKFTDNKLDPLSKIRRLGEARCVRDFIAKAFPGALSRIVIVGDFNDDPKSKPVQSFLKRGKHSLGYLVSTKDSRGECWTHIYHGKDIYSRVDYIIVSPEVEKVIKKEALRILDRQDVGCPRWEQPTDHRLVFLDWSPLPESH